MAGTDEQPRGRRRLRYRGTHPRRFEEKYKELNPDLYPDELEKVIGRGQTPAGTHRPICLREVVRLLDPHPGEVGLDATLGYGGHAQEILRHLEPAGRLFAIDVDPIELPRTEKRLRALGFGPDRLQIRRLSFAGIAGLLPEAGGPFAFALADLGVSSMQLDDPKRGFTYRLDGPLDLRFNPGRGRPASALLADLSEDELAALLEAGADEPRARDLARAIHGQTVATTRQLAAIVHRVLTTGAAPAPPAAAETRQSLQRVFQALRLAVNDELRALQRFLELLPTCLEPGGRAAILAFHSGEDRLVKRAFLSGFREGIYEDIASEPLRPTAEERRSNPRAASAKLRWALRASGA
ncbi:MAG: 16S rRNA (cytosine(1402)-N(4))-methyltransferase RsmH [Candidatus Schekmanbacteria bacterium]|nr:16S rRNA (cytosine(1402)-N(4))-methyltransferase RsmH [Candidatus Schekmanbacteria bacterium]